MAEPAYEPEADITPLEGPWHDLMQVYACRRCGALIALDEVHRRACPARESVRESVERLGMKVRVQGDEAIHRVTGQPSAVDLTAKSDFTRGVDA